MNNWLAEHIIVEDQAIVGQIEAKLSSTEYKELLMVLGCYNLTFTVL